MSTPYLRRHANGVWYIHWTEGRVGKRESTGSKDEAQARITLATFILEGGRKDGVVGADLTLADVWAAYHEKHLAVKAAALYSADMAWNQLRPYFGAMPATALNQDTVDEYVRRRTKGLLGRRVKPQTVAKELTYMRAAVAFCADPRRGIIASECAQRLTLPEQGPRRDRWLRPNEVQQLLAGARSFYAGSDRLGRGERFIWLALETAGREQALLDLTWDRIDFHTNTIQLAVPNRRATKKRRAAVPISKALRPLLERAYEERINDLVLDNGVAIWPTIQSIAIHAGLAPKQEIATGKKPKATGISPHVFRHTSATAMVRGRVPIPLVAQILGNSVKMVTDVYGHWAKEDLQDAVDTISYGSALAK